MTDKKLRVVNIIPTYNEKENIISMLRLLDKISRENPKYEFIHLVADDNSPDGTADLVRQEMKKNKSIRLIEGKKVGLGEALIRSYEYAEGKLNADVIIPNDCDFSFDPNKIPELLKKIDEGYDVVVASRHVGSGATEGWSFFRKLNHFVANELFAWYVAGITQVHDHNGNFKAIRVKGVLDKIPLYKLRVKGFGFQCFIIYQLSKVTNKFFEIPVVFKFRTAGETKVSFNKKYLKTYLRDVLEYMWLCINIRIEKWQRFIKFGIVGFIGFLINFFSLYLFANILNFTEWISWALSTELAIISNFIWNNIWTFKDRKITKTILIVKKFLAFNGTSAGALVIQTVAGTIGTNILGASYRQILLPFIVIFLVLPYNYLMYSLVIWKKKK